VCVCFFYIYVTGGILLLSLFGLCNEPVALNCRFLTDIGNRRNGEFVEFSIGKPGTYIYIYFFFLRLVTLRGGEEGGVPCKKT
jgi:hypothetical protein